ncbi:hypothetical protein [Sphingopyxis sp.]|uniref:hypothetical protein n=1 Tax=Sphingopyxis sp. TaxID=1908224 RepID=UPI0025E254E7|nr:hypothetical protein [Sphingopyxis sp.]MBK6414528.1 hypothetical protein [Sphingopyxis sp.]
MRHRSSIFIPAKAGISPVRIDAERGTPPFAGVTKKVGAPKIIDMARASLEISA